MSRQQKTKLVDRLTRLFDTRLAIADFFYKNACARHGLIPEQEPTRFYTEHHEINRDIESDQPEAVGRGRLLSSPFLKYLLAALLGGAAVAGPLLMSNYFSGGTDEQTQEESDGDGSLFQWLEDRGYHRTDGDDQ